MKLLDRALCFVLGLAFGAGCRSIIPASEYGVPTARYRVRGKVVSAADHVPVPGIRVGFLDATARSDSSGAWAFDLLHTPCSWNDGCRVRAIDDDGPGSGGQFDSITVPLNLTMTERPSGRWYEGAFEQTGIEIAMEPSEGK